MMLFTNEHGTGRSDADNRQLSAVVRASSSDRTRGPRTGIAARVWIGSLLLLVEPLGLSGAGPRFEETEVFVGGQDNINTYRIPSVVCTRSGTVLVFCEGRRDSDVDGSPTHLVLKRSMGNAGPWNEAQAQAPVSVARMRDRNITWQAIQILLPSKSGEAYMNPVPIIDASDGAIYLLVNYYPQPYRDVPAHIWLMKSKDEGATWSSPTDISPGAGLKELGPGIGIQMQNGRLVAPTYDGVIFSDDHGKTWKSGGKASDIYNETQVVELTDGSLMLNARRGGLRAVLLSRDGGQTWGEPRNDLTLTEPGSWLGCQASLIRYTRKKNGVSRNRLLFSNPADPNYRFDMTVRISYDEGKTWPVAKLIKQGTAAYSCLTAFPDGTIGLVYETGNNYGDTAEYYSKISFARFNLEWLTGGQDWLTGP